MPNLACFPWDEAAVTQLEALWHAGFSSAEIAKQMGSGLTRNSIIGKAHRLGLVKYRRPRLKPVKKKAPARKLGLSKPRRRATPPPGRFDLLDLRSDQCRYPTGDRAPYMFCGTAIADGFPYCPAHAMLCYTKVLVATI
jgi:hypothetical protein